MAAHRYWRVYITAANSGNYTSCIELRLYNSSGTMVATGGTAINSSTGFGWTANLAFDGLDYGTGWHSGTGNLPTTPEWIGYDLGSGNSADVISFAFTARDSSQAPKDFKLQYSDDAVAWTDAGVTLTNEGAWGTNELRVFPATAKTQWRLSISSTQSGNSGVAEFKLRTSIGGSDLTGGAASASSFFANSPTYAPSNAIDGNAATFWDATGVSSTLTVAFGIARNVVEYVIQAPSGNQTDTPKTWTLEYYDPNSSPQWVIADTQTAVANWTTNESRTYALSVVATPTKGNMFMLS